jgi:hypothetical protein
VVDQLEKAIAEPSREPLTLPRPKLFALRLALAALGMTLLFYATGSFYARALLPPHAAILAILQPKYEIQKLRLKDTTICLESIVHRQIIDKQGLPRRMKREVSISLSAATLYIQPIILLSLLAACPLSWRKKTMALLWAIPLLAGMSFIDIPFVLAWEVEDAIAADLPSSIKTIAFAGLEIQTRLQESQTLTYWNVFLQTGGRQFLALLGFFLCVSPFFLVRPASPKPNLQDPLDPPIGASRKRARNSRRSGGR